MTHATDIPYEIQNGADAYSHVIFGTHAFDPAFFESAMLPLLKAKDADSVLVLTDRDAYRSKFFEMQSAGVDYDIGYCHHHHHQTHGGFDARFALATWQGGGAKLVVSGSDLTKHGFTAPGGMLGCVSYGTPLGGESTNDDDDDNQRQAAKVLSDFGLFVSGMLSKHLIRDSKHRDILADACKMLPNSDADQMFDVNLLHNLQKPILHQLPKYVDEPIESAKILSPGGCDDAILEHIAGLGCNDFEVYVPPWYGSSETGNVNDSIIRSCNDGRRRVAVRRVASAGPAMPCARIIILYTATRSFCLYGGADASRPGMLATARDGNVGLCMLAKSLGRGKCDDILAGMKILDAATVSRGTAMGRDERSPDHNDAIPVALLGAHLDKSGRKLYIQTDTLVESGAITLRHPGDPDDIMSVSFDARYKNFSLDLDDACSKFCMAGSRGPTYVKIHGISDSQNDDDSKATKLYSDTRWLTVPEPVPKPSKDDIDLIKKTRGRSGFVALLYKLDRFAPVQDTAWFCRFLVRVTSKNLESVDVQRLQMIRRKFSAHYHDAEYQVPPDGHAINAMLGAKFEKTIGMTRRSMQEKYAPRRFDAAFDHFIMWSKAIIWLVAEKQLTFDCLRFIRMSIDAFLTMHKKNTSNKKIRMHLNRLHFWEHALWLLYIVLSYQRKAGYFRQNIGVANVFKGDVDMIFGQSGKKRFSRTAFEQIIREYSEFEENHIMNMDGLTHFYNTEFQRQLF